MALFDPKIKHHVIEKVEDVTSDGHCRYRCCAELLRLNPDDGWVTVRHRMLVELQVHKELHTCMLGGQETYAKVESALNYFETHSVSKKYWMQFPEMGCLFATAFNCVLCILSPQQYMTYLPLRLGPEDDIQIIQMLFIR